MGCRGNFLTYNLKKHWLDLYYPGTVRIFLRVVMALVSVTLFDSFRIRPPSIYGAPGMARTSAKMVVLAEKKFSPLGQKEPGWIILLTTPFVLHRIHYGTLEQNKMGDVATICAHKNKRTTVGGTALRSANWHPGV